MYIFKLITLNFIYDCLHKLNPEQFHVYYHYTDDVQNTAANRNNNLHTPMVRTETYGVGSQLNTRDVVYGIIYLWLKGMQVRNHSRN